MEKRVLRATLAILVLISLAISPTLSFAGGSETALAPGVRPAANSASPDAWEDGDDTPAAGSATLLTPYIPAEGDGLYTQTHTIDTANGDAYDADWYYFDAQWVYSDFPSAEPRGLLIEAVGLDENVDLVIEVYEDPATPGNPVNGDTWELDPVAIAASENFFNGNPDPAVEFFPTDEARYWIRVRPYYDASGAGFTGHAGAYTFKIQRTLAERVAGSDRIATAVEVSKIGLSKAPVATRSDRTILLANSMNYPDALAGASLVNTKGWGGSLLLTSKTILPRAVAAEIARTGAQNVYVLGGPSAVADSVIAQVRAIDADLIVKRLSGDDRIKTSIAIARETYSSPPSIGRYAIIAYGFNYPDALAVTPVAAYNMIPIFLTKTASLPAITLDAMHDTGVTDIIIVGGTSVVSANVYNQCAAYAGGADHVLRIAGANRYETAKEIASWACDLKGPGERGDGQTGTAGNPAGLDNLGTWSLGLASGENFPDALSGGVLCGVNGHPLLLTPKSSLSPYICGGNLPAGKSDFFDDAAGARLGRTLVFGGTAAVGKEPLRILSYYLGP